MFDPPTPEELLHSRFRKAAMAGRAEEVRQILAEHPQIVNDAQRMPHTVLQEVCLQMYSFQCKPEMVETMVAIVQAGGDMSQPYNYSPSPISTLLRRGVLPALRALHDNGLLLDAITPENREGTGVRMGVGGVHALKFVCVPQQWRDLDRNYPLADLVELLLEAGAKPADAIVSGDEDLPRSTNNSACTQLIWSLEGRTAYRPPDSSAKALALLMAHDDQTQFDEDLVLRAWRSEVDGIFPMVARRYFEQGGTHEKLQERAAKSKMKPELAARLQSDALTIMTPEAAAARKPGGRF